ncbi:MAG: lactonase family protein [Sporolactobacillus sp.]
MSVIRGYIGTYTTTGDSCGIYCFSLDTEKAQLLDLAPAAELGNPTYLAADVKRRRLFAVKKDGEMGGVATFLMQADGTLSPRSSLLSPGASPCYVALSPTGTVLVSANYHRGTVTTYNLTVEGDLKEMVTVDQHDGSGPNLERQAQAHVHFADYSRDGRMLVAVDLGGDRLTTYCETAGKLERIDVLSLPAGSGPRHLVFHPDDAHAYLLSELSSQIFVLDYQRADGHFSIVQTVSALPVGFQGHSQGAAIKCTGDGRFIYVSNRGDNSLGIFAVAEDGLLRTPAAHVSSGGNWPRDLTIDPTDRFVLAANEKSNNVVLFSRDSETGVLLPAGSELSVPRPVCIKLLEVD